MIERLRVRIVAGTAGEYSSPKLNLCTDSIRCPFHPRVTAVARKSRLTWTCLHPWPNEVGVGWPCRCPDIVWEPIRKRAHTQLVREHSATSSQLAEPLWTDTGLKSGISVHELISTWKKRRRGLTGRTLSPNSRKRVKSHHHHHHQYVGPPKQRREYTQLGYQAALQAFLSFFFRPGSKKGSDAGREHENWLAGRRGSQTILRAGVLWLTRWSDLSWCFEYSQVARLEVFTLPNMN